MNEIPKIIFFVLLWAVIIFVGRSIFDHIDPEGKKFVGPFVTALMVGIWYLTKKNKKKGEAHGKHTKKRRQEKNHMDR